MSEHKKIDKKDLALLDKLKKNSRATYSQLAKKIGLIRETAYYRILNLQKRGIIKKFVTLVDISKFGLEVYAVFLNLNASPAEKDRIIKAIIADKHVSWASSVNGPFDVIFAIQAKNGQDFRKIYSNISKSFQESIHEEVFSHRLSIELGSKGNEKVKLISARQSVELDELDKQIIMLLVDDSRINLINMSEKLKKPFTTIQSRIKRLQEKGIILGYSLITDFNNMNLQNYQLLLTTTSLDKEEYESFKNYSMNSKEITYFVETISKWSYELTLEVENNAQLQHIIDDLKQILGVKLKESEIIVTSDYFLKFRSIAESAFD